MSNKKSYGEEMLTDEPFISRRVLTRQEVINYNRSIGNANVTGTPEIRKALRDELIAMGQFALADEVEINL